MSISKRNHIADCGYLEQQLIEQLSVKIGMSEIKRVVKWASGSTENLSILWKMVDDSNRKLSVNALWVVTHLPEADYEWLYSLRNDIVDRLLNETDVAKKRMFLQLLRDQEYEREEIRTDLLDFCFSKINSETESYAVRCFSIYLAFKLCRYYPELLAELDQHLEMLEYQSLSPGLRCALRRTKALIRDRITS